jgi:hypothetical protein
MSLLGKQEKDEKGVPRNIPAASYSITFTRAAFYRLQLTFYKLL